jgi:hypothetical protein
METQFEIKDQQEKLAHTFIEEYLHREGYSLKTLGALPPEQIRQLMVRASVYASVRLAEIEDRAQLVESLHHTTEAVV